MKKRYIALAWAFGVGASPYGTLELRSQTSEGAHPPCVRNIRAEGDDIVYILCGLKIFWTWFKL